MKFQQWLSESTLNALYQSTTDAFPNTGKRQHSTDTIRIARMEWVPYMGMKTLYIRGLAQNNNTEYSPIVLFKDIQYYDTPNPGAAEVVANDGNVYLLERPSYQNNDVLVRCNCPDFRYRFGYYNHLDKSLFGRKPAKYESKGIGPPANPLELPGMCKHIMKLVKVIDNSSLMMH